MIKNDESSNSMRNRIIVVDCVRSICILYIVGIWHFSNYITGISSFVKYDFFSQLTFAVLGCFTMLSGLLTSSKTMHSIKDIRAYYTKRFLRLYPPYFVACIGFFITGWYTKKKMIMTMIFAGIFLKEPPVTLWYLNMIALFIAITPFVLYFDSIRKRVLVATGIGCLIGILCLLGADSRCIYYFPFYVLPLVFKKQLMQGVYTLSRWRIKKTIIVLIACVITVLTIRFFLPFPVKLSSISFLYSFIMILCILTIGSIIGKNSVLANICTYIAFASMNLYLFHRIYYDIITHFIINPIPWVLGYLVVLPSLIIVCYMLQKQYDRVLNKLLKHNDQGIEN